MQSSASKKSESKIINLLLACEATGKNPEFKVMSVNTQISRLKARVQSSEFADGRSGREKQPKFRIQSCDPSLREFGDERTIIENSESKIVYGTCNTRD